MPPGRVWAQLCLLQRVLRLNAAPPRLQSRTEEEQAGLRSELDIATAEVDRAQQRLLALEGEREKVMQQVGRKAKPTGPGIPTLPVNLHAATRDT